MQSRTGGLTEPKARHSDRTLRILNAFMPKRLFLASLKWKSQVKNVLGFSEFLNVFGIKTSKTSENPIRIRFLPSLNFQHFLYFKQCPRLRSLSVNKRFGDFRWVKTCSIHSSLRLRSPQIVCAVSDWRFCVVGQTHSKNGIANEAVRQNQRPVSRPQGQTFNVIQVKKLSFSWTGNFRILWWHPIVSCWFRNQLQDWIKFI